jgi:hypothetical protein
LVEYETKFAILHGFAAATQSARLLILAGGGGGGGGGAGGSCTVALRKLFGPEKKPIATVLRTRRRVV